MDADVLGWCESELSLQDSKLLLIKAPICKICHQIKIRRFWDLSEAQRQFVDWFSSQFGPQSSEFIHRDGHGQKDSKIPH
jgi:hypothetical protein